MAAVARRGLQLLSPEHAFPGPPGQARLDDGFSRHRLLTLVHIVPGLLFVLLAPLQFAPGLRTRRPRIHRVAGWIAISSGFVIGGSALIMSPQMAIGGINETAATMLFALLFLFSLWKGLAAIRRRRIREHREWMIRAFAIGLAVALVRPIVGIFFATGPLTHLTPHDFFGTAFWLGFTIQTMAGEAWIHYTRTRSNSL
ncbi:MAG TPA: DUF2306 domain-containing protein [Bryobacteraceae bacterium]|nr:DUF2306 domain-containing protein [Bryobacteraceae bacterium]